MAGASSPSDARGDSMSDMNLQPAIHATRLDYAEFDGPEAVGVSFEDRQDLFGHKSGRITTHYSQAELTNLIEAADKVCTTESRNHMA
jgi:hypothetical protein